MPNGTAQTEMSSDAQGATPRRRSRYSMTSNETTMPSTMHSAYARTGRPSTCHTDVVGLGMAARFTAAHATAAGASRGPQGRLFPRVAHTLGEFGTERAQPGLAGGRVGGVQHAADQRAADDHPV